MDQILATLRAIAEPTRLRLIALCAEGEFTVSELVQVLGQSQPSVSRHLKQLSDSGVLQRLPEGSWVFYRLARDGAAGRLAREIVDALPADDRARAQDRDRLAAVRRTRADAAQGYFRANAGRWDEIRSLQADDRQIEARLLGILPPEGMRSLLDVGTGTGRILELYGAHGVEGVGIDLSHDMLSVARANLARAGLSNVYVRQGDMYRLPWSEPSFDAVTFHQVLHFADEPAAAIAEACRVLRPGGRMVIVDFAPHDVEILRREHAHRRLGFSDDEVRGWLSQAGLRPRKTIHISGSALTVALWSATAAD
jgi:ubiquinone/menaquinone biosynthesis C-methylase UbiE/DNA-binding transcriptional ArsR family regulator